MTLPVIVQYMHTIFSGRRTPGPEGEIKMQLEEDFGTLWTGGSGATT